MAVYVGMKIGVYIIVIGGFPTSVPIQKLHSQK